MPLTLPLLVYDFVKAIIQLTLFKSNMLSQLPKVNMQQWHATGVMVINYS